MKALVEGILKLVSEKQMDKILEVFSAIKKLDSGVFEWQWESLSGLCVFVCIFKQVNKRNVLSVCI